MTGRFSDLSRAEELAVYEERSLTDPWPWKLPLYRRDGTLRAYALIDEEDYERLRNHRWCIDTGGYVYRHAGTSTARLHREVLGLRRGDPGRDHRNGQPLDNRKENLRPATPADQQQNRRPQGGTSRHRGVVWHKHAGKWMAQVWLGGKNHCLGYFDDEDKAGAAAHAYRLEHMPFYVPSR